MNRNGFYNPDAFRLTDAHALGHIVDDTVFGMLASNGADGPRLSHVPFLLDRHSGSIGTLRAHLARQNDHWRHLDGETAVVVFHGPAHYVTPSWYASKAETGRVVPTWNYVVVHARGRVRVHREPARLRALVQALTDRMESPRADPWGVDDAPAEFIERLLEQIVGVDVTVEHLEGKLKLGQNRPVRDQHSLAAGVERERPDVWAALQPFRDLSSRDR